MTVSSADLTVVIPTYNRSLLLARAVESVRTQSVSPAEIIVVDDGSEDDTPSVLESFGDAIRAIRQPNAGSSAARNRGVEEAGTEWIAFLDSDDVWRADHLERSLVALRGTEASADLYFADALTKFPTTMAAAAAGDRLFQLGGLDLGDAPFEMCDDGAEWAMKRFQPMLLQASIIRRDRYRALGGLRQELHLRHDVHLFFRLAIGRPVTAMNHIGTEMTADGQDARLTVTHGEGTHQYSLETALLYRDLLDSQPMRPDHRKEIARRAANAELRLAKLALEERQLARCARHLFKVGTTSPETALRRAIGRRT
jgi:glycosyltransferase involved in cell wall biosynthesis